MMDVFNYECDGQMSIFDEKPLDNNNNVTDNLTNERTNERTIRKVHCFFEQSGTFKNEFRKLGYEAYDYDILDDYGQTDFQVDLFAEIEKGYNGEKSVFDDITPDDLIMAFFPCTYFSDQSLRHLNSQAAQLIKCSIEEKCENAIKRHKQISIFYEVLNKFVILSQRINFKLVIENPYSTNGLHYLKNFWFLKPSIIDKDRTKNGDYFKKPTQYWFVNFEPKNNLVFEQIDYVETKKIKEHWLPQVERSMIHPQYANRFIRQYLIDPQ